MHLVVTKEEFTKALKKTIGKKGMTEQELERISDFVMGLFGVDSYIVDNMLTTADRDIFYMLEEARLLTTMRDEVTIAKGKIWRIHYWILAEDIIKGHSIDVPVVVKKKGEFDIYKEMDDENWKR